MVIMNFLVTIELFLNAKVHYHYEVNWHLVLNANLFLIKTFLITKFDFQFFKSLYIGVH